jgi:hypothetical protein
MKPSIAVNVADSISSSVMDDDVACICRGTKELICSKDLGAGSQNSTMSLEFLAFHDE